MRSKEIKDIRKRTRNSISTNLRKYRAAINIPQHELAKKVGLAQSVVARLENGTRRMLAEELPLFAEVLGVNVLELLD